MRKVKIFCAVLCSIAILSAYGCGDKGNDPTMTQTEPAAEQSTPVTQAIAETQSAPDSTAVTDTTDGSEETTAPDTAEATIPGEGLNSTDVAQVLAFYKLAAAKNDTNKYTKKLALISIDGGEGWVGSMVSRFEPIAQKAIDKNSVTNDPLPGDYKNIRPTDWSTATAVSDGKYTTITVQVVPQTDGANGKLLEGTVGRSMSVLDGIQTAVDEMPGVSADFANGKVKLQYLDPTICVKIDNRTGEFVKGSCKWYYRVHPTLYTLDAKVLAFTVHIKNGTGYVDYTVTY